MAVSLIYNRKSLILRTILGINRTLPNSSKQFVAKHFSVKTNHISSTTLASIRNDNMTYK